MKTCKVCGGKGRVFWDSWIECKGCNVTGKIADKKPIKDKEK